MRVSLFSSMGAASRIPFLHGVPTLKMRLGLVGGQQGRLGHLVIVGDEGKAPVGGGIEAYLGSVGEPGEREGAVVDLPVAGVGPRPAPARLAVVGGHLLG